MTMAIAMCDCPCHNSVRGDYNDAWTHGSWHEATALAYHDDVNRPVPVPTDDVIESAVACTECLWRHVAVFTNEDDGN